MTVSAEPHTTIDPKELRRALSCFPTGVAVVTTLGEGSAPIGITVSSFNSVSMEPPLILWSLLKRAGSLPAFKAHGAFAVNVLSAKQEPLCRHFSTAAGDRFESVAWREGIEGIPVIDGAVAVFECRNWAVYPGGDHEIFLGQVVRYDHFDTVPLVFGKGKLGPLATTIN
ncbi:MAG: flavin reductase family protein [Pseudomonadota bacterium]